MHINILRPLGIRHLNTLVSKSLALWSLLFAFSSLSNSINTDSSKVKHSPKHLQDEDACDLEQPQFLIRCLYNAWHLGPISLGVTAIQVIVI